MDTQLKHRYPENEDLHFDFIEDEDEEHDISVGVNYLKK